MSRSLEVGKSRDGRHVVLYERDWDGIGRPEYTDLESMDPDKARYMGQQMISLANKIDNKPANDRTHARIKKNTAKIIAEAKAAGEVPGQ